MWSADKHAIPDTRWRLCATVFLCALAFSYRTNSFYHAKELVLHAGLVWVALASGGEIRRGLRAFAPLWIGLAVSLAASLLRFPELAHLSLVEAERCAALLLLAALAVPLLEQERARLWLVLALVASALAAALLAIAQFFGALSWFFPQFEHYNQPAYSVFGNQDLLGGYLALALPLAGAWAHRPVPPRFRVPALLALAVLATGLALSGSRSAWIAALTGWAVLSADRRAMRLPFAAIALGIAIAALSAGPYPLERAGGALSPGDTGIRARLWFWDGALRMAAAHPVFGAGLGAFPARSPRHLGEALHAPYGERHFRNEIHTLHAHSEPLEYAAETGLAGLACGLWMLLRLWPCANRTLWAALVAQLVFALFNPAWRSPPHALAMLLLCAMLLAHRPGGAPPPEHHAARWPAVAAAMALTLCWVWSMLLPALLLRHAENLHLSGAEPRPAYARAIAYPWPAPEAREEYAMALQERGQWEEAHVQLVEAHRLGLDTGRLHLLLACGALAQGLPAEAETAARACLLRWPDNTEARRILLQVQNPPP